MKPTILQVVLSLEYVGEKMVSTLARSVSDEFNVMFCCLDSLGLLGEELKKEGFSVTVLDRKPGFDGSLAKKIARLAKEKNIDIIHAHHYSSFFYSALAKILFSKPRLIFTEHGRPLPDIVDYKRKIANLVLRNLADKITAVSEVSKKGLCKNEWIKEPKVEVIYNGVDLTGIDIAHGDNEENIKNILSWIDNCPHVVGFLARLDPIKAPEVAIKAFAKVAEEMPDAKLIMIGKENNQLDLRKICRELGIQDKVLFTGLLKNPYPILEKFDVLVAPSLYEAASLAILEAMARGIPVVVSRVGGNPELVREGSGFLVNSGDSIGFAKAIITLLRDKELNKKFGEAARKIVKDNFSLPQMDNAYRTIYHKLANRRILPCVA